jgi:hypothetical protein
MFSQVLFFLLIFLLATGLVSSAPTPNLPSFPTTHLSKRSPPVDSVVELTVLAGDGQEGAANDEELPIVDEGGQGEVPEETGEVVDSEGEVVSESDSFDEEVDVSEFEEVDDVSVSDSEDADEDEVIGIPLDFECSLCYCRLCPHNETELEIVYCDITAACDIALHIKYPSAPLLTYLVVLKTMLFLDSLMGVPGA